MKRVGRIWLWVLGIIWIVIKDSTSITINIINMRQAKKQQAIIHERRRKKLKLQTYTCRKKKEQWNENKVEWREKVVDFVCILNLMNYMTRKYGRILNREKDITVNLIKSVPLTHIILVQNDNLRYKIKVIYLSWTVGLHKMDSLQWFRIIFLNLILCAILLRCI